jgi:hypothetical protein
MQTNERKKGRHGEAHNVNPTYNGTAMDRNFFLRRKVPFSTGTSRLDHRDRKHFPLKTSFHYANIPFKTGFTVVIFRKRFAKAPTI